MAITFKPITKQRVNLVIKDHVIRYCYSEGPELDEVKYFGEKALPTGTIVEGKIENEFTFSSIIQQLVEEHNWKRKKLYFCVPDSSVVIRPYQLPRDLEHEEVKGYLYMKLGEELHLPFEAPVFDYYVTSKDEELQHIMLFAYPEETIKSYETIFEEAKLKPMVADLSSLSLYRLYFNLDQSDRSEHLLSLQWNVDGCVVTAFNEGTPSFIRHMKSPLDSAMFVHTNHIHSSFSWEGDGEEYERYILDQILEVERIMNFYRYSVTGGKDGITKVLLTGDLPNLEYVYERCVEKLSVPVKNLNMSMLYTKEGYEIPNLLADTIGLSLKE